MEIYKLNFLNIKGYDLLSKPPVLRWEGTLSGTEINIDVTVEEGTLQKANLDGDLCIVDVKQIINCVHYLKSILTEEQLNTIKNRYQIEYVRVE